MPRNTAVEAPPELSDGWAAHNYANRIISWKLAWFALIRAPQRHDVNMRCDLTLEASEESRLLAGAPVRRQTKATARLRFQNSDYPGQLLNSWRYFEIHIVFNHHKSPLLCRRICVKLGQTQRGGIRCERSFAVRWSWPDLEYSLRLVKRKV